MRLNPLYLKSNVIKQLKYHFKQLLKGQSTTEISVVDCKDYHTSKFNLTNNLVDKAINVNQIKLEFDHPYQTVIRITDKNDYSEYVSINFQIKDINILIEKIKQVNFSQFTPKINQVSESSFKIKEHIHETFEETKNMQIIVNTLNDQSTNILEDKEYTLNVEIEQVNFQVKWKINLLNEFANDVNQIEQNVVLPSNFYAGINSQTELTRKIDHDLKRFYDNDKFSVLIESELLNDENNKRQYDEYRISKFGWSGGKLAEFDAKKILAPVKYIIKIQVHSKTVSWLSKTIEKTILINEKP